MMLKNIGMSQNSHSKYLGNIGSKYNWSVEMFLHCYILEPDLQEAAHMSSHSRDFLGCSCKPDLCMLHWIMNQSKQSQYQDSTSHKNNRSAALLWSESIGLCRLDL